MSAVDWVAAGIGALVGALVLGLSPRSNRPRQRGSARALLGLEKDVALAGRKSGCKLEPPRRRRAVSRVFQSLGLTHFA